MITFFTVPKPFIGIFKIIQENALLSWKQLNPACEIIVIGDDLGCREICERMNLIHIDKVDKNKYGTPLVNSIFKLAESVATYDFLCYINTDIILLSNFNKIISKNPYAESLIIGRRWDVDIDFFIDFSDTTWEQNIIDLISERGKLHSHTGVDYFIYSKGLFVDMPPFAIGRTTYDNWFIWKARTLGKKVIDASSRVTCIHQNHERTYSSIGYEKINCSDDLLKGVEKEENIRLAEGWWKLYTLLDATHHYVGENLKVNHSLKRLKRIIDINIYLPIIRFYQLYLKKIFI